MELTILLLVHVAGICSGLREVRIQMPTAVKKGDSAILNCWYDTEGDPLYAVKWYKGGREFYRYAPNETPVVKTFPIGNLTVKKAESNATQIGLTNLELDAAGVYSCEVSADLPSFHTAIVSATMNVVELPSQGPSIHGLRRKYRIDDTVRLNCTSGRSKPAANLTWYINDRQPPRHQRIGVADLPDRASVLGDAQPLHRWQAEDTLQRLDTRHLLAEHRGQRRGGQAQGDTLRASGNHSRHQLSATAA
ncbi:cell adhesion molecule 3-like isoform X2 [Ptiloglossa arizonensis]|uniref:cell adhesion molecule 3-like isoform X2 n=1 Tax=Ptiloglossa arizonensis TaxID=3350558 RepID=UPI003FA17959